MIELNLTADEYKALLGLLDAGARSLGIAAITVETLALIEKLKGAQLDPSHQSEAGEAA